jgi:hypothetical protein
MPVRVLAHVPDLAVAIRTCADGASLLLGRAADCDLTLPHDSVSRHHARLTIRADGSARLEDLGSKNGLRIDSRRVPVADLVGPCWFALGDVYCEFQPLDAQALAHAERRAEVLRQTSASWTARLSQAQDGGELLDTLLAGIVELAECRRGFVLAAGERGATTVRARFAISADEIAGRGFSGSRGAVDRCLQQRRPVFLSDAADRAALRGQPSVVGLGIRALACLPLLHEGRMLGAVYADTDDDAKVFTELDAELLAAFADRAAAALALADLDAGIAQLEGDLVQTPVAGR